MTARRAGADDIEKIVAAMVTAFFDDPPRDTALPDRRRREEQDPAELVVSITDRDTADRLWAASDILNAVHSLDVPPSSSPVTGPLADG